VDTGKIKGFRDLIVWQKSMIFAEHIYNVQRGFPAEERFALCDQLRRAAVSIPSNIAEGRGRGTAKDFVNFLRMSKGSVNEILTQLDLAVRFGYLDTMESLEAEAEEILKMLNTMISRLTAKPQNLKANG